MWKDKDGNEVEKHPGGRPVLYESTEEVEEIINSYFKTCGFTHKETGEAIFRPTMSGLALYLNMSRETLCQYAKKDKFSDAIIKARQTIEMALERNLYSQSVAGTIFNLKNNFGWKDKTELESTSKIEIIEIQTDFGE